MTNNKQQTAVKLYTEEQVLQIIGNLNREYFVTPEELLEEMKYTSIKLPSDEEIEASKFPLNSPEQELWNGGYEEGAKWMRDKIQGGEQ
jgi:protein-L-isoaspartate O-methyltransferase